ncbi:CAP Gly-rich domain-containing protein [Radiomyces spectabilis]|uniref:CAP Gly-rich domain-containing protein n=1 Tax=Radiomyces spectabilis TaxID=64574 RepID=UPI002220B172|nr:CAP Gly-rich domain-containing protein [Radiomyces spectabilis]KAI8365220.1 CAP Gly-rich domain-containing protein [Radiomyces spectabilis]
MPIFRFRKAARLSDILSLRKTKSTGDIEDPVSACQKPHEPEYDHYDRVQKSDTRRSDTSDDSTSSGETSSGMVSTQCSSNRSSMAYPPNAPPPPPDTKQDQNPQPLATRLQNINANDMELLLSMETQARMDYQEEQERLDREAKERMRHQDNVTPRPTRLKFELPSPPRPKTGPSPSRGDGRTYHRWSLPEEHIRREMKAGATRPKRKKKHSYSWSRIIGNHDDADDREKQESNLEEPEEKPLVLGAKVRLLRRPLPILGYVRYIGPVDMPTQTEQLVGVELESRVGNNDGSINGKRYFQTDPHRGIFLTYEEVLVL